MKQMKRWIITFLLGLVAFLGLGTTVDARSLVVDKYDIEANILEMGTFSSSKRLPSNRTVRITGSSTTWNTLVLGNQQMSMRI